jgi:hypothetical protein
LAAELVCYKGQFQTLHEKMENTRICYARVCKPHGHQGRRASLTVYIGHRSACCGCRAACRCMYTECFPVDNSRPQHGRTTDKPRHSLQSNLCHDTSNTKPNAQSTRAWQQSTCVVPSTVCTTCSLHWMAMQRRGKHTAPTFSIPNPRLSQSMSALGLHVSFCVD